MSLFLAPIHTWLFNKIVLLEHIEKKIIGYYETHLTGEALLTFAKAKQAAEDTYGAMIPELPLESLIDTGNIHGWLQNRITIAEQRQARLFATLLQLDPAAEDHVAAIYKEVGQASAVQSDKVFTEAVDLFNTLNDYLLEGMPCDRVNAVVSKQPDTIVWKTVQCVHRGNWEQGGVDVKYYYTFRKAFISGFAEGVGGYAYASDQEDETVHQLQKVS